MVKFNVRLSWTTKRLIELRSDIHCMGERLNLMFNEYKYYSLLSAIVVNSYMYHENKR